MLPLLETVFRRDKHPGVGNWRIDEAYIKAKGVWKYRCPTVDNEGKTVDFLITAKRDKADAMRCIDKVMWAVSLEKSTWIAADIVPPYNRTRVSS